MFTRCTGVSEPSSSTQNHRRSDSAKERPTVSSTIIEGAALSAADRCDRCGAQAYVRVTLASGSELLFCAHHSKEHADKLRQVALKIQDETQRIG
jgi:hypothetical protein